MARLRQMAIIGVMWVVLFLVIPRGGAQERKVLPADTLEYELIHLNPAEVDPSLLPLDTIEELGVTGVPPSDFEVEKWELLVTGERLEKLQSFTYKELLEMPMVKKRVLLICPGFFADYAEWEGIPLQEILARVTMKGDYKKITFVGYDGYRALFSKEEVEKYFLLLALKVNGEVLPLEHGFPVRLVAEDVFGGRWVKWISTVTIE